MSKRSLCSKKAGDKYSGAYLYIYDYHILSSLYAPTHFNIDDRRKYIQSIGQITKSLIIFAHIPTIFPSIDENDHYLKQYYVALILKPVLEGCHWYKVITTNTLDEYMTRLDICSRDQYNLMLQIKERQRKKRSIKRLTRARSRSLQRKWSKKSLSAEKITRSIFVYKTKSGDSPRKTIKNKN